MPGATTRAEARTIAWVGERLSLARAGQFTRLALTLGNGWSKE